MGGAQRGMDAGRRSNLSLLLSILHQRGPIPRAELTRLTGLNRSTISTLITRLRDLGLVEEQRAGTGAPGRPSLTVSLTERVVGLAVNPEVDSVTVGATSLGGTVIARRRIRTPTDCTPEQMVEIAARAVRTVTDTLSSSQIVTGIGVAVPGLTDMQDGVVRYAPHLGRSDAPFAAMLHAATGLHVVAANDASVGISAELLYGAGLGSTEMLYLNAGRSGIRGGIVSDGALRAGAGGYAGEFGHIMVRSNGRHCECGSIGCLQTEISQQRTTDILGLEDVDLDELERAVTVARMPALFEELRSQAHTMPRAISAVMRMFDPSLIVLGGYLAVLDRWARRTGEGRTDMLEPRFGGSAKVVTAELGSDLLIIGAAELTFSWFLDDPLTLVGTALHPVKRRSAAVRWARTNEQ